MNVGLFDIGTIKKIEQNTLETERHAFGRIHHLIPCTNIKTWSSSPRPRPDPDDPFYQILQEKLNKMRRARKRPNADLMDIIAKIQKDTGIDVRPFYSDLRGDEGWINEEFLGRKKVSIQDFYQKILPKILSREGFQEFPKDM